MPRPRSETTLDDRGRARRTRERRAAELQALRRAVLAVDDGEPLAMWRTVFRETIERARQAIDSL